VPREVRALTNEETDGVLGELDASARRTIVATGRRQTGNGQGHQVHVQATKTLTVIFPRFDPAPVGRMAATGLAPGPKILGMQSIDN
jgi:hypothetical protein